MVRSAVVGAPMTDPKARADDISDTANQHSAVDKTQAPTGFAPVIRSKIQPPAIRPDTLTRDRLVKRLDEAIKSRLTLVTADAGYGKTTFLADYLSRAGARSLWYRLDPSDADAVTWTSYLVAACREVDPSFGHATWDLLGSAATGNTPPSAFVESLLGELGRWKEAPTILVLDDFHEVDNNLEVAEVVHRLVSDGPGWLRIVISGRRRPQMAFGRLAAAAELAEIGTDDLRFSISETEALFAESYSQPLDGEVLKQLDRRARGWVASLQLFHGSTRGRSGSDIRRLASALSGASGPVYDFLAEEVLSNVPPELADFLIRASLVDRIDERFVSALFDEAKRHDLTTARLWIGESVRLGLLGRSSDARETFEFHPLLRDFLVRQLETRLPVREIHEIHKRIGDAIREWDALTACHHYIEAGSETEAMDLLGSSVLATLGSGQWGVASSLIDRLKSVPAGAAVAAIRARHLTSAGNPAAAARLLSGIDISNSPADVRAVFRQTWFSIAWRTGERDLIKSTTSELLSDPETPRTNRAFAEIIVDSGTIWPEEARPVPHLGQRLLDLADFARSAGHWFYSGISMHNASIAFLNAADYHRAIGAGEAAIETFGRLGFEPAEVSSTRSILATSMYEAGRFAEGHQFAMDAMSDNALADVPAELSVLHTNVGDRAIAQDYLSQAEALSQIGHTDVAAAPLVPAARAALALPDDPRSAVALLTPTAVDPLDLGQVRIREVLLATSHLIGGNAEGCLGVALPAMAEARRRQEKRAEVRLAVLIAIATENPEEISATVASAWSASKVALSELADAICQAGQLMPVNSEALGSAISAHPARWLPALRRILGSGAPRGLPAAILLDKHGEAEDVPRLRAFSKAYRTRGASPDLGLALSRRTSPKLTVNDLGRAHLAVADRVVVISGIRRKAAALLMYLATQPNFTANKEQVLDELWPDADPSSATNSLNQSLYFLRREIDPWYEDDVSVDYVHFSGDLIWLDANLVSTASSEFLKAAAGLRNNGAYAAKALDLVGAYRGQFAPEFEYEDWAIDWRSRVHSVLLELAHATMERLSDLGDDSSAREVAIAVLEVDPTASDIERNLIRLLWRSGASSAAKAQYSHLARLESRDGFDPESFEAIVRS